MSKTAIARLIPQQSYLLAIGNQGYIQPCQSVGLSILVREIFGINSHSNNSLKKSVFSSDLLDLLNGNVLQTEDVNISRIRLSLPDPAWNGTESLAPPRYMVHTKI